MMIRVESDQRGTYEVHTEASHTIDNVNAEMECLLDINADVHRLFFGTTELDNCRRKLSEYGIQQGSTLFLGLKDGPLPLAVRRARRQQRDRPAGWAAAPADFDAGPGADEFQLQVKDLVGKTTILRVKADNTVSEVKAMIQDMQGIPPDQQRLISKGDQLSDHGTLWDYEVVPGATIHLVLRLRGGGDLSRMEVSGSGDTARLLDGSGDVIATFGLRTASMADRMQAAIMFKAPVVLANSQFQALYKGTGQPRNVPTTELLKGLVRFGVWTKNLQGHTVQIVSFQDTDGDSSNFALRVAGHLHYTSSNPRCSGGKVTGLVVTGETVHCTFESGPAWQTTLRPADSGLLTFVISLAAAAGVPHNGDALPKATEESESMFEFLAQAYQLHEPAGAVRLYTSDIDLHGDKLYRALARSLNVDDRFALEAMVPYLIRFNSYLNDNSYRHPSAKLFSGSSVAASSIPLLTPGSFVRIPRMLSATAVRAVAERFRKDIMLIIHVPKDFWGARAVNDISDYPDEAETIFCPYSQFLVLAWDPETRELELAVVDKYHRSDLATAAVYHRDTYKTLDAPRRSFLP